MKLCVGMRAGKLLESLYCGRVAARPGSTKYEIRIVGFRNLRTKTVRLCFSSLFYEVTERNGRTANEGNPWVVPKSISKT